MHKSILDAMEEIADANRESSKAMISGAKAMIRDLRSRQATFDSKHKEVKEKIERGAKLTKHRISL